MTATTVVELPRRGGDSYLTDGMTISSWLLTHDHKRIAILYCLSITAFFFIGGTAAAAIRLNLITPQGLLLDAETYNRIFTLHGVVMVWLFLVPSIPTTFGNFLLPLMIGAKDLAFPRIQARRASEDWVCLGRRVRHRGYRPAPRIAGQPGSCGRFGGEVKPPGNRLREGPECGERCGAKRVSLASLLIAANASSPGSRTSTKVRSPALCATSFDFTGDSFLLCERCPDAQRSKSICGEKLTSQ